ncbi:hypothetical protein A1O3_01652 [Capronia epimyces CBS 606.96]|uniref:Transcription factor TFIIIC triple barrel domain-containing protein n=1 Tax=Capronia epimyces CBS 606.96 TaxID=1182542 RepID=W9YV03_9EURO|nr:uncharacterized protein A1O3_01652 [Capronia epimyces CBS 606.96]EXJ93096.1 hypothetical protein A1O3_01652 [Capronia epimyces CBS 606.96]
MDQPRYSRETTDTDEDEYEYEYDDTETETFLVDLDLSSLNPITKLNVPGAPRPVVPAKRPLDISDPPTPDQNVPGAYTADPIEDEDRDLQEQRITPSGNAEDNDDDDGVSPFSTNVQILDLNSENPVISYLDQVYSCTWTDLVGTSMFFTNPGLSNPAVTLLSTDDYDLIGTSRIKLVGDRATVSRKAGSKGEVHPESVYAEGQSPQAEDEPRGRSLGSLLRTNPKTNVQIKKQAAFLEKLMDLKRQRGEEDVVRAYVDETIASSDTPSVVQPMQSEVEELNQRLVKGDAAVLARLQEIYSHTADQDSEPGGATESPQEKHD